MILKEKKVLDSKLAVCRLSGKGVPYIEIRCGLIQPKQRPRRGRGGHFYTPKETRLAEDRLNAHGLAAARKQGLRGKIEGPITLWAWLELPTAGDVDNGTKLIKDALQETKTRKGVYGNDRQIENEHVHRAGRGQGSLIVLEWGRRTPCCAPPIPSEPAQERARNNNRDDADNAGVPGKRSRSKA